MTSTASETPVNVLVKINKAGAMSFPSCDLHMDKGALLDALAESPRFAEDFRRVSRTKCTVFVFWAANDEEPALDKLKSVELTGLKKIRDSSSEPPLPILFIHVLLPEVSGTLHVCD